MGILVPPSGSRYNDFGFFFFGPSRAEQFNRGIKKDKDHYPEFKDEKGWDNFRRSVETTARTHGTHNILNGTFVPTPGDVDAVDLFEAQKNFMYCVFESKLKTDRGMGIVRLHENDRDAQAVWRELTAHQTTSTTGTLVREDLLGFLTTFKLTPNNWKGTFNGFLINYQDKLREFERLTPNAADHFSDEMKRTLLQASVSQVPELHQIQTQSQFEVVHGRPLPNFDRYIELVSSAASVLDKAHSSKSRTPRPIGNTGNAIAAKSHLTSNVHDWDDILEDHYDNDDFQDYDYEDDIQFNIDTNVHDLQAYNTSFRKPPPRTKKFHGISIDRETWMKLPEQDKARWDTISPQSKNAIISGTRQRAVEVSQANKNVPHASSSSDSKKLPSSSPSNETPTKNTRKINTNDVAPSSDTQVNNVSFSDNDTVSANTTTTVNSSEYPEDAFLVNLAKSRVPSSDIRSILSQPSNKKNPPASSNRSSERTNTQAKMHTAYSANSHHIDSTPTYSSSSILSQIFFHPFLRLCAILLLVFSLTPSINKRHDERPKVFTSYYQAHAHDKKSGRGSLIDRGANGGIAGDDVKVISYTDRLVDVTGIDNHQITSIRIGTVGAVAESQRGSVIVIMHQYALHQRNRTIHSCVQLEHFKNQVDDRSLKAGGMQRVTTNDGYVFPLDIIDGLPYLKMRPYKDEEFDSLPHVILTSDTTWEHNVFDCTLSDKEDWFQNVSDWNEGLIDSPFDLNGTYKNLAAPLNTNLHDLLDLNSLTLQLHDSHPDTTQDDISAFTARKTQRKSPDYESLRPFFLNVPADVVKHTLSNTTQYARHILSEPTMYKSFRSPFPACNVRRRREAVATDTVFADVPAIDTGGITQAQVFVGRDTYVIDIFGMKSGAQFVNTLLEVIRKRGAMDKLISDSSSIEISKKVLDVLRHLQIDSWQSEPYFQHQNFAERRWQDTKRLANWIMGYKNVPDDCWLLCLEYVADIMNITANQSLNWETPLQRLTGQTPDSSIAMVFEFYDEIYYRWEHKATFPSETQELKGRFVGFSKHVGHALTFKVLSDGTRKILHRSVVRRPTDQRNLRVEPTTPTLPPPSLADLPETIKSSFDAAMREGSLLPTIPAIDPTDLFEQAESGNADNGEPENGEQENGEPPNGEPTGDLAPGRTLLMPKQDDGQRFRAKIIERLNEHQNKTNHKRSENDQYRVLVGHEGGNQWEEIVAYNDLMDFIDKDESQHGLWKFREIQAHQGPLNSTNPDYKGSRWNVLVAWETGEVTWEPLHAVQHEKVVCAIYAREHDLLELPGWKQFRTHARRQKKLLRMANQAKLQSFHNTPVYMFGILVPRNHDQAMEFDAKNGNTLWLEAEKLEAFAVMGYGTFNDKGKGGTAPNGYKKITIRFVYAVKHDGRHKARLVAGGHLTDTPIDSVYSSVASLRGVRMITFLAELNGLEFWSTDIGNAYLESDTMEKVYVIGGKELEGVGLEGHTLVIVKALYGLKSSGARWWEVLADVLRQMGFVMSKAEHDIWMRPQKDHYEYIIVYVDDLGIASHTPQGIAEELTDRYGFKLKGTGPTTYHLGIDYFRDSEGVLCMAPKKYIDKMLTNYERLFGSKPRQYSSPLEQGDHPEIDNSQELGLDDTKKFQSLIGALQWVIQIGRFDVGTAVMTLSSFRANPRVGHLTRVKRIYGYLYKMKNGTIRIRVDEPDLSDLPNKVFDWEQTVYAGAEELIPIDVPTPKGKSVVSITFVDANLYHDLVSGKSVTGIMHILNKTLMDWYTKKQATVETATYGSEFVASRTAMEQIIDLRTQLRYLGVQVKGSTMMFGDNESVVNSSSLPYAQLHKRHNALSFHRVREGIAAGNAKFHHVKSANNPADVLSKHWGYSQAWPLLQPLLFWEGDTMDLVEDDDEDHDLQAKRGE